MSLFRRSLVAFLSVAAASLLVSTPALAQSEAPPPSEPGVKFHPFTVELNPIGIIIGRFSANFEYLPVPHHALVISPFFWTIGSTTSTSFESDKSQFTGYGGEIGYHFWTGERGANGFFVGPSLVAAHFTDTVSSSCTSPQFCAGIGATDHTATINYYGVAVDLGGQHIFDNGFTIGGGGGLQFLKASGSTDNSPSLLKVSGTFPRFLFSIGYSW